MSLKPLIIEDFVHGIKVRKEIRVYFTVEKSLWLNTYDRLKFNLLEAAQSKTKGQTKLNVTNLVLVRL